MSKYTKIAKSLLKESKQTDTPRCTKLRNKIMSLYDAIDRGESEDTYLTISPRIAAMWKSLAIQLETELNKCKGKMKNI